MTEAAGPSPPSLLLIGPLRRGYGYGCGSSLLGTRGGRGGDDHDWPMSAIMGDLASRSSSFAIGSLANTRDLERQYMQCFARFRRGGFQWLVAGGGGTS